MENKFVLVFVWRGVSLVGVLFVPRFGAIANKYDKVNISIFYSKQFQCCLPSLKLSTICLFCCCCCLLICFACSSIISRLTHKFEQFMLSSSHSKVCTHYIKYMHKANTHAHTGAYVNVSINDPSEYQKAKICFEPINPFS